jgi:hypothetical protein
MMKFSGRITAAVILLSTGASGSVHVQDLRQTAAKVFSAHGIQPQWDLAVPKSWLAAYERGQNWGAALDPVTEGYGPAIWQRQVFQFGIGTYSGSTVTWQKQPAGVNQPWLHHAAEWRPVGQAVGRLSRAAIHHETQVAERYLSTTLQATVASGCLQQVLGLTDWPRAFVYAMRLWNARVASVTVRYSVATGTQTDRLSLEHRGRWRISAVNDRGRAPVTCPPWTPPANAFPGTFAVGDSVMVDAQPYLQQMGITVDAAVSRQFDTGVSILAQEKRDHTLPPRVIIGLGTNGPMTQADFNAALAMLRGEKRVVVLTVREPRWWQGQVNSEVRRGAATFKNARIADWYATSAGHPEYFAGDGIHLTTAGALAYAHIVANALSDP